MQKDEGQPQQVVMVMPLLEGLDGVKKMSKSYGNYIGVSEPPQEMFGKLMSVSDELMARYYTLLLGQSLDPSIHPMEAKKSLAEQLTARYHGQTEATAARTDWDTRFSKKDLNAAELPELNISELPTDLSVLSITSHAFKSAFDLEKSNGELRKQFILSGSVQLNGEKLTDPTAPISLSSGDTLKLSKKHAVRFI
jgi:tyrosyl-tRNA synthetase